MDKKTIPTIHTPHNNLFVQVLSRKEKAIAFFKKYLPASILEIADLNQIELAETTHISDSGKSLYNDILYRCPLGNEQVGYFFAMCEHQSKPDPHMPLRLAEYNLAAIKGHLKQGHAKFPIIVNTVFYTGKRPWKYSTTFSDYYANPHLGAKFLYMAPFQLVTLKENQEADVYRDPDLGFCLVAFYCGNTKDPYQAFKNFKKSALFQNYFNQLSLEDRLLLARYLGLCVDKDKYSLGKIVDLVIIQEQEKEVFMRSVAQEYIEQGIYQGIEQGIQQGMYQRNLEIAKSMLKEGFDVSLIAKVTNLSRDTIEQLRKG
jgi:predicted transposase YdaD